MKTRTGCVARTAGLALALSCVLPHVVRASDHADPTGVRDQTSNITGLFVFPDGDRMVLILNIRPALVAAGPYDLEPFEYVVSIDHHTEVTFDSEEDRLRYGGTIADPEGISADVSIRFSLNDDATVRERSFDGLKNTDEIRIYTGVRDDPFIFPRFFGKNVVAIVMSLPISSFPPGRQEWILWATTYRDGKQIDHVGRAIRSQLPRFGYLNALKPSEMVAATMEQMRKWNRRYHFLMHYRQTAPLAELLEFTFLIRKYDLPPDVLIYTTRFPPGYPNGRRPADDVVGLSCTVGNCLLQEIAFIEGSFPRQTVNDKPLPAEFPYLAEPWPDKPAPEPAASILPLAGAVVLLPLVVIAGVAWLIRRWRHRRTHRAR